MNSKTYHMLPWQPPGNTPEEMYGMWRCSKVYWHGEKKKKARERDSCDSAAPKGFPLGDNVHLYKQSNVWKKHVPCFVPAYLHNAIQCSDLPEVLYWKPLLFLWLSEKKTRPYKFDQGIAVLPNTPAYDLRLTYRFQHGFHHSVVQTHAQGKSLEKHDIVWEKALTI